MRNNFQSLIWGMLTVLVAVTIVLLLVGVSLRLQAGLLLILLISFALMPLLLHPIDIFAAKTVFIVGYIIYSFVILFAFFVSKQLIFIQGEEIVFDNAGFIFKLAGLYALGILGFYLGYISDAGSILAKRIPILNAKSISQCRLIAVAVIYMTIGVGLLALLIVKVGGLSSYLSLGYGGKHLVMRGLGWLVMGIYLLTIGLLLLYWWLKKTFQRGLPLLLYWVLITLCAWLLLMSGRRFPLFLLSLGLMAFYHYNIKPFSIKKALAMGFALFLVFSAWAYVRGFTNIGPANEIKDYVKENINYNLFNPVNSELGVVPFIFMKVIKEAPKIGYRFGMTYLEAIPILIPKILYPSRPLGQSEWFVSTYYPYYYAEGGGLGFSYLAESYLNFSIFGPFIISLIVGVLYKMFDRYRNLEPNNEYSIFIYAASVPWLIWMFRSDFASILKGYFVGYLIPIILALGFVARGNISLKKE